MNLRVLLHGPRWSSWAPITEAPQDRKRGGRECGTQETKQNFQGGALGRLKGTHIPKKSKGSAGFRMREGPGWACNPRLIAHGSLMCSRLTWKLRLQACQWQSSIRNPACRGFLATTHGLSQVSDLGGHGLKFSFGVLLKDHVRALATNFLERIKMVYCFSFILVQVIHDSCTSNTTTMHVKRGLD